mmetsp:Transcript_19556/g.45583  ORF Transcript_19556/g.45583 Transcript_19556/m.45583 type:complete len:122 (-) Transcript_19556:798-1163(-)
MGGRVARRRFRAGAVVVADGFREGADRGGDAVANPSRVAMTRTGSKAGYRPRRKAQQAERRCNHSPQTKIPPKRLMPPLWRSRNIPTSFSVPTPTENQMEMPFHLRTPKITEIHAHPATTD